MGDARNTNEDPVKKRIARYDYYYDVRTYSYALRKTTKPKKTKDRKHALVVRRLINERGRYTGTVIDIKSVALLEVLQDINDAVEGLDLSSHEPQMSPEAMFHSYPGLLKRLKEEESKESRDDGLVYDLTAAIQVIEEDQAKTFRDVEKLTSQGEITFDLLWTIFRPNSLAFAHDSILEQDRLLLVRRVGYAERRDYSKYLAVACDVIRDDGSSFGLAKQHLEINQFAGARKIVNLSVYPLGFHPNKDDVYSLAVEMGKKVAQMPQHNYVEISGPAMRDRPGTRGNWHDSYERGSDKDNLEKFFTSGRVMISPSAFYRFETDSSYNPRVHRPLQKDDLTEDKYAICSPILLGFAFDRKSWGAFAMSRLKVVQWNDDAFRALVLGDKQKKLIHGLVRQHVAEESGFDDVIKGKGRGLIGLLAGTPGCGKTLTAEAVAETTRKPLYAVSAGELGTKADVVESRLMRVLELAQMWDAVLLLDEAEVFLQQRSTADVDRNALVSIFLRQLEYYQGILILTTNMAESTDRAFESRIHFSVHYPELDVSARKLIWKTFFSRAELSVSEDEIDRLAAHRINGRQIKNAFSSAQTISLSNGSPRLTIEDIDVVLGVLHDWQLAREEYMQASLPTTCSGSQ